MGVNMKEFSRLLVALDVLKELGTVCEKESGIYYIPETVEKTDLANSKILNRLEGRQSL